MDERSHSELVPIGRVAEELGVSVSRARQLANAGYLPFVRTGGGHRRFDLAEVRARIAILRPGQRGKGASDPLAALGAPDWRRTLGISGLEEHVVLRDVEAALGLEGEASAAAAIFRYAFCEMLNNAIEHSEGTQATVSVWSGSASLGFEVLDDGVGCFAKVRGQWDLDNDMESILELSKGKRTSAPDSHTGEGIFFTSRAVDGFRLDANGLSWTVDNTRDDQAVGVSPIATGTSVGAVIARHSQRTLQQVFERYTRDLEFVRSGPRLKLAEIGGVFVSRSEARRLTSGLEKFREVELDFSDVESVGQGFVDEVFRVWAAQNPDTLLVPVNMNPAVEFMVRRGLPKRST